MKKRNILFAVIVSLIAIASTTVFATSVTPGIGDLDPAPLTMPLFTICNKTGGNCVEINTSTINTDKTYDNFEIRDREIYLNNNEITLEFANIWSELKYKIHVTGANKITYLNSINKIKIDDPVLAQEEPDLYASDYIPFTVEGDGTLEIETVNQIKTNASGERYYECWGFFYSSRLSSSR